MNKCLWVSDDNENYITGCDVNYRYVGREPINYCPYCGRFVKVTGTGFQMFLRWLAMKEREQINEKTQ